MKQERWVYPFGKGHREHTSEDKQLLGGKGAGLATMSHIGLPVPPGFTVAVPACAHVLAHNGQWPAGLEKQVKKAVEQLESDSKLHFGDSENPLLVSVRSGAAVSMPGMLETVLNLGLNDTTVQGLISETHDSRFAWDCYRRFVQMYSTVVCGLSKEVFERRLTEARRSAGVTIDSELPASALQELCGAFQTEYRNLTGNVFPQDPWEQLHGAIDAVFRSWNAEKSVTYRRVERLVGLKGTAVNVQQMVFGNVDDNSGTGVCFTRDPSTGANEFYGELLINAQGEDVVAGIRTPLPLISLRDKMPEVYDQLLAVRAILETHYGEMQDLEFTVERGQLFILQCRSGKRTPTAAFRIAVEQATKPLITREDAKRLTKRKLLSAREAAAASKPVITREQAVRRIKAVDIERLFYPVISPQVSQAEFRERRLAKGINAVPGAAAGAVAFSAHEAERRAAKGEAVILVRPETSPEDVGGMQAAQGILTQIGGKTSHAAVVARGWGKCCIVGCTELEVDEHKRRMKLGGREFGEGDTITLDGSTGEIYAGALPLSRPEPPPQYQTIMQWVDEMRFLRVRANADTPEDARKAIEMGAEGIGLCRTEHMFFATHERQLAIQEMIVADDATQRGAALAKLLPYQREDFIGIFEAMAGRPVTIRLIDPPLHEFLPRTPEQVDRLAKASGRTPAQIERRSSQLHETNPMLGHRGCRLCLTYPEILDMQVRAIIEAAIACQRRGVEVLPEIMIPLTIDGRELQILVDRTRAVAEGVIRAARTKLKYLVGTMIETPRAAILADKLAESAEFFSFGTNDLTQLALGLSRDDAGRFLPEYLDQAQHAIFADDPFQSLDVAGVGALVSHACASGRNTRKKLKLGICGEHGGDPATVRFCHDVGLDYVSCSPYRVPIARLAAAQAALAERKKK